MQCAWEMLTVWSISYPPQGRASNAQVRPSASARRLGIGLGHRERSASRPGAFAGCGEHDPRFGIPVRGIDQTYGKPAIQGGFDYSHSSGVYLGNWDSNVSQGAGYPGGKPRDGFLRRLEKAFGDFGLDLGAIYYYYPG